MQNINAAIISGNLTRDAEIVANGNILEFSVACNERRKVDGEWSDYPNFFDCVVYGQKRAEGLAKYLSKGLHVNIFGSLHQHRYETKDGQKRQRVTIQVDEIDFTAPKNPNEALDGEFVGE